MRRLAPVFAVLLATSLPVAAQQILVEDAYARSANQISGAAFMVLVNPGSEDDRLIAARSPAADRVELHTHLADPTGVMRMVEVEDGFAVPAGGRHELARGGDHVMFLGLTGPLEAGGTVPLTLLFERAGEIELEVTVDNQRGMGHGDHGHAHPSN